MNIAFTIPIWILWVLGVPIGIAILLLACLGFVAIIAFKDFKLY